MTDLTKLTTPFGLLDDETREALISHNGPYEVWGSPGQWDECPSCFYADAAYRVKPQPPKPREWWAVGRHLHDSRDEADEFRKACADSSGNRSHLSSPIIYVREVLE